MIHPIAAGDMYGIAGVDHIAEPGLIKRIIGGSYPSGPSGMPSPKIWQLIDGDADRGVQPAERGPVPHACRCGGGSPRGADESRARHVRRPAPAGRPHEPGDGRGHRPGRRVRRRRVALFSRDSDRRRDRAGNDRGRAGQHLDGARRRLSRRSRSGAGGAGTAAAW